MFRMKNFVLLGVVMLLGICAAGCAQQSKANTFRFGEDLAFVDHGKYVSIDVEHSSKNVQEKHSALQTLLPDVETAENIVALTTTTANILWEAGITPIGAPESKALNPEIQNLQYKLSSGGTFDRTKVLNIGSALTPNTELIIELNPKIALYSDALMHSDYISTLENANVNVAPLGQSDYIDMFVLMDVLSERYQHQNEKLDNLMRNMVEVLKQTNEVIASKANDTTKTVAILQLAGESVFVNGDQSVLGQIVKSIGVENVFASAQNVELNQEALIASNPDYIIYYSHGMGDPTLDAFEERLTDPNGILYAMDAVKNGNAFAVQGEDFTFAASVDTDIIKVIRFLANKIYGEV